MPGSITGCCLRTVVGLRFGRQIERRPPRTRRRFTDPSLSSIPSGKRGTIKGAHGRYRQHHGRPLPITLDSAAELERSDRRMLESTSSSWLTFGASNVLLVSPHDLSLRDPRVAGRRSGSTVPNKSPARSCEAGTPVRNPGRRPPARDAEGLVELTCRDTNVLKTKTLRC